MTVVPLNARVTEPPLALIMSAAYVEQELAAEFGHLPPCFLPVATQRLYEHQRSLFPADWSVHVALPASFDLAPIDRDRLASLGLTPLALPDGISLGDAVAVALDLIDGGDRPGDRPVVILHGDTLVDRLPVATTDWLAVAERGEGYAWAEVELDNGRVVGLETVEAGAARERLRPVACGVFAFSHSAALARAIDRAEGDFIRGIALYGNDHRLSVVPVAAWYDFGHVQTFFRSRRIVTSARSFNTLQIDGRIARKTSADGDKMRAEAHWLDAVPPEIRIYAARLLREGADAAGRRFYETEYAYLPTLSELFVFATLGRTAWLRVLESCRQFLVATTTATEPHGSGDAALAALVLDKTERRLRLFADHTGFSVDVGLRLDGRPLPSLMRIAADLAERVDLHSGRAACVMHGDFCFSNILYDSRVQRVRVIDPRGTIAGPPTIYGDLRYDLAKLAHSIVGRYDQIIAGRYVMSPDDGRHFGIAFETAPHHAMLEEAMPGFVVDGVSAGSAEVRAITAGLFLSMLPLHADRPDRQRAFIANALRLYAALERARDKAA